MKLTKNGEIIELLSEKHANKFKENGWKEVKAQKPKPKLKEDGE